MCRKQTPSHQIGRTLFPSNSIVPRPSIQVMKTYPIIISQTFPKSHPKAGQPTGFVEGVRTRKKLHTIRKSVDFWIDRIQRIGRGEGVLSVRTWSGKPYRSPQIEVCSFPNEEAEVKPSYEYAKRVSETEFLIFDREHDLIKNKWGLQIPSTKLAENDGLSHQDFLDWFRDVKTGEVTVIIHFQSQSYHNQFLSDKP